MKNANIHRLVAALVLSVCLTAPTQGTAQAVGLSTQQQRTAPGVGQAVDIGLDFDLESEVMTAAADGMTMPLLVAGAGGPQGVGIPGVDLGNVLERLRENAMGHIKNCDYVHFLNVASSMGQAWDGLRSLSDLGDLRKTAAPFMDIMTMLFRGAGVAAARKSAEAETTNLLWTLEQVCNTVVQADEVNRTFQVIRNGQVNIGNALNALFAEFRGTSPGADDRRLMLARFKDVYVNSVPAVGGPQDSLHIAINTTLENTLLEAAEMDSVLTRIEAQVVESRRDLFLLAQPDSANSARWTCPEGYPDPNAPATRRDDRTGRPICGPCPPERCQQVTATLELLKTQMQAIQLKSDARALEVESVRLMADNQHRREKAYNARVLTGRGW
jgi:hypothetical protein